MNNYRKEHINYLLHKKGVMKKELKEYLGLKNDEIVRDICNGGDMHVSRLIKIANYFGVSCAEFFEYNGNITDTEQTEKSSETITQYLVRQIIDSEMTTRKTIKDCDEQLKKKEVECIQRLHDQQIQYEQKIAALNIELTKAITRLDIHAEEVNLNSKVHHYHTDDHHKTMGAETNNDYT